MPKITNAIECPICLIEHPKDFFPEVSTCDHQCCAECYKTYLRTEIMESRVVIKCPQCDVLLNPNDIENLLQDPRLMERYHLFMLRRVLANNPDTRFCPAPDCEYAVIVPGGARNPKLHCGRPGCGTAFCYNCRQYWHPKQTCEQAQAERQRLMGYNKQSEVRPCPQCGCFIAKLNDGSCNHMRCAVCGTQFCWLCMKIITEFHYITPSGCTLWGKKPWGRKRRIFYSTSSLIFTPVFVAFMAVVFTLFIIIGLPFAVIKDVSHANMQTSRTKQIVRILLGLFVYLILVPIFLALALGLGIPYYLIYLYVENISILYRECCGSRNTRENQVKENKGNTEGDIKIEINSSSNNTL